MGADQRLAVWHVWADWTAAGIALEAHAAEACSAAVCDLLVVPEEASAPPGGVQLRSDSSDTALLAVVEDGAVLPFAAALRTPVIRKSRSGRHGFAASRPGRLAFTAEA